MRLLDVSQYVSVPYRSGIQRVLWGLADRLPMYGDDWLGGFRDSRDSWNLIELSQFADVVRTSFESQMGPDIDRYRRRIRSEIALRTAGVVPLRLTDEFFQRVVLPEPTPNPLFLGWYEKALLRRPDSVGALVCDCFPETAPEFFHLTGGAAVHGRFYRLVRSMPVLATISDATASEVAERLRRPGDLPAPIVLHPGADCFGRAKRPCPSDANFLVVGTVEPRKKHAAFLDAMEELWRRGAPVSATILGAPGWASDRLVGRLRGIMESGMPLRWIEDGTDADLRESMIRCTAMVALGPEGFGLPAAEAATWGVPCVVGTQTPFVDECLEFESSRVRLENPEALVDCLESLMDVESNEATRASLAAEDLPTWDDFARGFNALFSA